MSQSWSSKRKKLENEFLCQALRGRVQYFFTIYHGAPDDEGRFAVRIDGKEFWHAHAYNEGAYNQIANKIKREYDIPNREWDGKQIVHDRENREAEDLAVQIANDSGIASTWDVLGAIEEYLNLSIQDALQSNNSIIRMFAILDRRVGKRTLLAVQGEYSNSEEWLKEFYELRMQAEGLCNT